MRAVIQRVLKGARVKVDNSTTGSIEKGLLVLLGVEDSDTSDDIDWLARKIINMRIFGDEDGMMNLAIKDIEGDLLVISQFTLYASTKKGNRPSFIRSAKPDFAQEMYEGFIEHIRSNYSIKVETGIFAADMKVELINDGPVTIIIDSKNKE